MCDARGTAGRAHGMQHAAAISLSGSGGWVPRIHLRGNFSRLLFSLPRAVFMALAGETSDDYLVIASYAHTTHLYTEHQVSVFLTRRPGAAGPAGHACFHMICSSCLLLGDDSGRKVAVGATQGRQRS